MLGRALVLYVIVETGQEQCIGLQPCGSHGRNSLLCVEDGGEGFMVCYEREPPPIEVHMEPLHPHTIDNASLSICAYLRSVLVNDRDAKATGLSLPSGIMCERTAPMPVGEARHHMQA